MSLVFVILCWFSLGISALYWLRFDAVTMWICRPHVWWETRTVALSMTLSLLIFTLCATVLFIRNVAHRKGVHTETDMMSARSTGSEIENGQETNV